MASTYTTNLGIEKIGTGEQSGTWGNTTNTNLDILDEVLLWMEQYVNGDNKESRETLLNMSALLEVKDYIKNWQVIKERNAEDVAKRLTKAVFDNQG